MEKLNSRNASFYCEPILASEENVSLIKSFETRKEGQGLCLYLKKQAINDELDKLMRTYLVKDKETKELVGYFSLKAGMVTYNESILGNAFDSMPGIEIANFAVNEFYKKNHAEEIQESIGVTIFVNFILPIIEEVSSQIGIKIIYVFALPSENLIKFYQKLNFQRLPRWVERKIHKRIKPNYDKECIFMCQLVKTDIT